MLKEKPLKGETNLKKHLFTWESMSTYFNLELSKEWQIQKDNLWNLKLSYLN
jgi:hypothetical protein